MLCTEQKDLLLKSPANSAELTSLSASASSPAASLNSTPDKKPETKKRRRKLRRGVGEEMLPMEMAALKSGTKAQQEDQVGSKPLFAILVCM